MADYSQYQGPSQEWQEFVMTTAVPAAGPAAGQSVEEYQKATNQWRELNSARYMQVSGLESKVSIKDFQIPTRDGYMLPVRVYRSNEIESTTRFPVYIFFHGGGYMFGTVSSEDATCSRIAAAVRIVVVHVCYRHTPQFKYPKPYHDAWDAFEWVVQHVGELGGDGSKMIAGGISSGGGLAASIVLKDHIKRMSDGGISPRRILGQILMIPSLIPPDTYPFYLLASTEISSYQQNISSPILPTYQRDMFHAYLDAKNHSETPFGLWSKGPLGLEGMPKTTIVAAGMDSLRDEALLYAEMLEEKDVPTKVHIFPGLPHGFRRYESLPSSRRWDEIINESILWILENSVSPRDKWFVEST